MTSTMSLSPCSHQAEFCCHAATQSHSIILRSIKRCGYPGRRESCLSFHSHRFFLPLSVFFVSQHFVLLTPLPTLSLTSNPPHALCLSLLSFTFFLLAPSSLHLSPPRGPSSDDEGAQYQGKSSQGVCSLLSFIFLCQILSFVEHSTVTNIQ